MQQSRLKSVIALALIGTALGSCGRGENSGAATDNSGAATENAAATAEAAPACDRDCLIAGTDKYLAALAAHDPKAAPLSNNVLFVENAKRMQLGEGLWKTATGGKTGFSIHVPDTVQQQAGWMGVIQQNGKPVMLALRLKFQDGRISEAEHLIAAPARGNMDNLQVVRPALLASLPAGERLPHDQLIRIGATYYDALDDNGGSKMAFAEDCQRRENGITTAGEGAMGPPISDGNRSPIAKDCKAQIDSNSFEYIETIDDRRMVAADPVTGLAMGLSHFHHSFKNLPYQVKHVDGSTSERNAKNMPYKPFDMPSAHIFKIGPEGMVHEIEAVGVMAPYNTGTGRD